MSDTSTARNVIGIDLGATNMLLSVVCDDGRILARQHALTEAEGGFDHVIDILVHNAREVLAAADLDFEAIEAVGVAVAGAVDIETGIVLDAHNLKWRDQPFMSVLQEKLGKPIVIDNDVNAAVWGEYRMGAGRERGDCFGVWVGTGIGGGLVLNEKLYHGAFSTAGEFGLTISDPRGEKGFRTVEDFASRTGMRSVILRDAAQHPDSMLHALTQGDLSRIGTKELTEAYEHDDTFACQVIDDGAALLGIAIANFVTMLSVDTVIVGGGITEALGDRYLQRVRDQFDKDVFPDRCRSCQLVKTTLESDAGVLGAAMLALDAVKAR